MLTKDAIAYDSAIFVEIILLLPNVRVLCVQMYCTCARCVGKTCYSNLKSVFSYHSVINLTGSQGPGKDFPFADAKKKIQKEKIRESVTFSAPVN